MVSAYHLIKTNFDTEFSLPEEMAELRKLELDSGLHQHMVDELNRTLSELFQR